MRDTKPAPNVRRAAYSAPTRSDMAVLMVLFNPTNSVRLIQNWLFVWNRCQAAGIPVFGAELLFPWQRTAALSEGFKSLTVRSDSIMFHKEKLLMRLAEEIPLQYTKLCCIDCDVIFERADWYDAVSVALDIHSVVQPYSVCNWLGPDLRAPLMSNPSAAAQIDMIRAAHAAGTTTRLSGHPGFAMAMRRDNPLFPYAVVGGGDAVFFRVIAGLTEEFTNPRMSQLMAGSLAAYAPTVQVGGLGVVEGGIWHMWHGPIKGRQYYDRYVKFLEALSQRAPTVATQRSCELLEALQEATAATRDIHELPEPLQEATAAARDIRELLVENGDGVWEWREDLKKPLNAMMLRYFAGRDDDAVQ